MRLTIPDETVTVSLDRTDEGDVAVHVNGLILLWVNHEGTITRCSDEKLATLGFKLDDEDCVVMA